MFLVCVRRGSSRLARLHERSARGCWVLGPSHNTALPCHSAASASRWLDCVRIDSPSRKARLDRWIFRKACRRADRHRARGGRFRTHSHREGGNRGRTADDEGQRASLRYDDRVSFQISFDESECLCGLTRLPVFQPRPFSMEKHRLGVGTRSAAPRRRRVSPSDY